jgi:hypothetical protein
MSKKNNKPTLDESEYFDEIQAQVTELMGPPPLRTTPSSENIKNDPLTENIKHISEPEVTSKKVHKAEEITPLSSDVPKPPLDLPSVKTKKQKVVPVDEAPKDEPNKAKDDIAEPDIVADKSITIEEAEELSKKVEKIEHDTDLDNTDSIYSSKVSLAVEDIESREASPTKSQKNKNTVSHKKHHKISKKKLLIILLVVLVAALIFLFVLPKTRYLILNNLGARSSISFKVVDSKTNFPISGAEINIQGYKYISDDSGSVKAEKLKLGPTTINIKKRSFDEINQNVTIGWGSNPISAPFGLNPSGNLYSITITDWMTKKGIEGVSVVSADSRVTANKSGVAEIVIDENAPKDIKIESDDYRNQTLTLSDKKSQISLVPSVPNYFITEKDGKYNLEKIDLDGKNRVTIFGGTGSENLESMSILPKPTGKEQMAAFVSTRLGQTNSEGYLLSDLFIVLPDKKIADKVPGTQSEKISLIGWDGPKIIFIKTVAGPSAAQEGRQRIISFDTSNDTTTELAKSDNFSDYFIRKSTVYYSTTGKNPKLLSVQTDGSSVKTILNKEIWAIEEISDSIFAVNTSDKKWQRINFNNYNIEEVGSLNKDISINTIKKYSPSGSKLSILEKKPKGIYLVVNKSGSERINYDEISLSNLSDTFWINENYLLVKPVNLTDTNAVIVNINSEEPQAIE